jgi:hypothetical protein
MNHNSETIEIFNLDVMTDTPPFEGFGLIDAPSAHGRERQRDDMSPGFGRPAGILRWKQILLAPTWDPPQVVGRVGAFNDYPCISLLLPAFSQRACDALRDMLEPNGELLPLRSTVGVPYYFYNITTVVDALDAGGSDCFWFEEPIKAGQIDYFSFRRDKLKNLSIFRIYEYPVATLVTSEFVQRVRDAGLNGFDFRKVWPLPLGVNWRTEQKTEISVATCGKELKHHTIVIQWPLAGNKPNAVERKLLKHLENELDAQLAVPSLEAPFFGCYEGSDKVAGEFRMFLSCPDADRLVEKLHPWLSCLSWASTVRVLKRYGDMHDPDAEESPVCFEK